MKKTILTILTLFTTLSIFSTDTLKDVYVSFLPTMEQNNNIDMQDPSPVFQEYATTADLKYDATTWDQIFNGQSPYQSTQIIGVAGLGNIPKSEFGQNSKFEVILDAYMNPNTETFVFRSESNTMYQRPFEIHVITSSAQPNPSLSTNRARKMGKSACFRSPYTISNSDGVVANAIWEDITYLDEGRNDPELGNIYVDLVLALPQPSDPNEYSTNMITIDSKNYYLAEASDYSTVLNVTMRFTGSSGATVEKTVSIPFSGYFRTGGTDDNCTVSIYRLPKASNLSIEDDNGTWVPIGDVNLLKTFRKPGGSTGGAYVGSDVPTDMICTKNTVSFFVSSSKNPYANGGEFKLVNTNVQLGEVLDERNSIGYTIRLKEDSAEWDFDGQAYVKGATMPSLSATDGSSVMNTAVQVKGYYEKYLNQSDRYAHFHQFMGEMLIMIDPLTNSLMEAGAYTSNIYIHIFTSS